MRGAGGDAGAPHSCDEPRWPPVERRQPYDRAGEDRADLIASGDDTREPGPGLPPRWRHRLTLGVVLAVGVAIGGYGGYIWPEPGSGDRGDPLHLTTSITAINGLYQPYPPYRLAVRVRNEGGQPVQVERMRPLVPGLQVAAGPRHPQFVRPGESATTLYAVQPSCAGRSPQATAAVRVRARAHSGTARVVTLSAPVAPAVRDGYAILCGTPPARLVLTAETLTLQRRAGGLFVRLELAAVQSEAAGLPAELRVLRVGLDSRALETVRLSDRSAPSLPATIDLELQPDCDSVGGSAAGPVMLRVALTSAAGPHLGYAHTDTTLGTAVEGYLADACGTQG